MSCARARSSYGCASTSSSSRGTRSAWWPERELRVDEVLLRRRPHVFEPRRRGRDERLVREVGKGRAAPEREGRAEGRSSRLGILRGPRLCNELLELSGVSLRASTSST